MLNLIANNLFCKSVLEFYLSKGDDIVMRASNRARSLKRYVWLYHPPYVSSFVQKVCRDKVLFGILEAIRVKVMFLVFREVRIIVACFLLANDRL
jgi:hypothetical protein